MVHEDAHRYQPENASVSAIRLGPSTLRFLGIAAVAITILAFLLWREADFDRTFLLAHNPLRDHSAIVALSNALSRFGMSAICLLVLAAVAASFRSPTFLHARPVLLVVLFSFAAATLAATLLKELFGRARPIVDLAGQLNVASLHDSPSFPSGHAAQSLALALPIVILVPGDTIAVRAMKFALLFVASLVGYSRIVKGAHYPSDVLAGIALALLCVPLAVAAANAIYTKHNVTPEKLGTIVKKQAFVLLALALALPFL